MTGALFIAALLTAEAGAEPLTRQRVLELVAGQNPQVVAERANVAAARARKGQASAAKWPLVTLQVGTGPALQADLVPGTAVESVEDRYSASLDDLSVVIGGELHVVQPLYTFGKIALRQQAAEKEIAARQAQVQMTAADVALEAARLYEGALFAGDAILFFEDLGHQLQGTIRSVEERLDSQTPDVDEQDLLRLQVSRYSIDAGLNRARAARRQAIAGLGAYLGQTAVALADEGLHPVPAEIPDAQALLVSASENRPELVALELGASALHRLADAQSAGLWPDVFALGFLSGAYTPGRDRIETRYVLDPLHHFTPGLLLGIRWQIQGAMAVRQADETEARARRLESLSQWARAGIPAEVRKAHEDVERARLDQEAFSKGLERARRWAVRASADFRVGFGSTDDVADAVEAYVLMRTGELDAVYRYNTAVLELARATGRLLGENALYPGGSGATD